MIFTAPQSIRSLYPKPQKPHGWSLLIIFMCWLLYSLSEALILQIQHHLGWSYVLKDELFSYGLLGIYSIPVWYLTRYRLQSVPWPTRILVLLLGSLVYACIWLITYLKLYPYVFSVQAFSHSDLERYWLFLIEDAIRVYIIVVAITYSWTYHLRLRHKERREAELVAHNRQIELSVLKSQLNPHFLFNTLNAVNALVGQQPEKARQVLALLGQSLRYSLESDASDKVPLAWEIEFTQTYLAIEKVRFAERLLVHLEIDPMTTMLQVPPMILQPLVENAVGHGIASMETGGEIWISTKLSGNQLEIRVDDSGSCGVNQNTASLLGKGRGLHHTHLRLQKMYGDDSGLEFENTRGFGVRFTIPAEAITSETSQEDATISRQSEPSKTASPWQGLAPSKSNVS